MSPHTLPPSVDPLGVALHDLRMSGAFYARSEFTAPWGLDLPPFDGSLMFHVITAGRCWLETPDEDPICLQAGDLGLVPHGTGHRLVSEPGTPCTPLFDLPREYASERYEILRHGGGGAPTTMICGAVGFDRPTARRLIDALPRVIHVDAWNAAEVDWLQSTLRFMESEARRRSPGGEAIVTRLCDVLVIQAIRSWLARDPAARTGWLGALRDDQIGSAIAQVHRDPSQDWTVGTLAETAAMSRSAFAARFSELVGETPMRYVTAWRMQVAATALRNEDVSVGELARRLGYRSEAAFSRAFKRAIGVSPGAARRGVPELV